MQVKGIAADQTTTSSMTRRKQGGHGATKAKVGLILQPDSMTNARASEGPAGLHSVRSQTASLTMSKSHKDALQQESKGLSSANQLR